jgi:hypothetical protein
MASLNPNYRKRDYLLPAGCRDLIDVLNLGKISPLLVRKYSGPPLPRPKSPKAGTSVELAAETGVKELAGSLGIQPFWIIADLLGMGLFASLRDKVKFEIALKLLSLYGVFAKKIS